MMRAKGLPGKIRSFLWTATVLIGMLSFFQAIVSAVFISPAWAEKKTAPEIVAAVNGTPVYRDEFDAEDLEIQKTLLGRGRPLACEQVVSIQKSVLESLIRREVLCQEARKTGIKADEKVVDKEMRALKARFSDAAEFQKELDRRKISEGMLRSRLERNSVVQQYLEKIASNITVTDSDTVDFYQKNIDRFKQPLQVRVSHILIKSDPVWDSSKKQVARRKAVDILNRLKKGEDFAALAKKESDGPTKAEGGDLGYIKTGQLEKKIETAVFALKPGETSGIIETPYGFNIFKVTDKKPETVLPYDSVKEQIRLYLVQGKAKQEADLRAGKRREKAGVKILMDQDVCSATAVVSGGGIGASGKKTAVND